MWQVVHSGRIPEAMCGILINTCGPLFPSRFSSECLLGDVGFGKAVFVVILSTFRHRLEKKFDRKEWTEYALNKLKLHQRDRKKPLDNKKCCFDWNWAESQRYWKETLKHTEVLLDQTLHKSRVKMWNFCSKLWGYIKMCLLLSPRVQPLFLKCLCF